MPAQFNAIKSAGEFFDGALGQVILVADVARIDILLP